MLEIHEPLLSDLTTLHLGGKAIALLLPESVEEMAEIASRARCLGGKLFCIGRGSNLLAKDGELPLVLTSLRKLSGIEIVEDMGSTVRLRACAGVPLPRLLRFCLEHGLSGLEGLAGVPGSVGGACAMNAGSFGTVFGDYVDHVQIWDGQGFRIVGRDGLEFSYRSFKITEPPEISIVVFVTFTLTKAEKDGIFSCMSLNYFNKKTRQPLSAWSAGCAFRNPAAGPTAGMLLDRAGLRGCGKGGMIFSPLHANFLVNEGNGTSIAALDLLEEARSRVFQVAGVKLEPEIKIIPWP